MLMDLTNADFELNAAVSEAALAVAVIIPCFNEERAIASVVKEFRRVLPTANVYVYDNSSTDRTSDAATAAGAITRTEPRRGKGHVVRRMFADVDADIYVLVDGDNTYDPEIAPDLIKTLVKGGLDMVNCARKPLSDDSYRTGHRFGNRLLTSVVRQTFGKDFQDMLSGYRVFSRRFVKSFPGKSTGFEIETELTIHALDLAMPTDEVQAKYQSRPAGSESKLRTISDGLRISWLIFQLLRQERPMVVFGMAGTILAVTSIVLAYPLFVTYFETGLVPRLPTAVLSSGTMLLSSLSFVCGLILDTVTWGRRETKRMSYLGIPGVLSRLEDVGGSLVHRVECS